MVSLKTILVHPSRVFATGIGKMLSRTLFRIDRSLRTANSLAANLTGSADQYFFIVGGHDPARILNQVDSLRQRHVTAPIVILASNLSSEEVLDVVRAGANAVVDENLERNELVEAFSLIAIGLSVLPRHAVVSLIKRASTPPAEEEAPKCAAETLDRSLSSRELSILQFLTNGASNKEIARDLKVTEATVKVHVKAVLRKIRVKNRTQAAIWATQHLAALREPPRLGGPQSQPSQSQPP